jgi:putative ABC transport system permease protein
MEDGRSREGAGEMITGFITRPIALLRLIYQSVCMAMVQIWANKTRSVLTTLGIIIGVASVTAVIAALTGLKAKVISNLESFGTNNMFIMSQNPRTGPMKNASWWMIRFRPEEFDNMLAHCPSVEDFTRITRDFGTVTYGRESAEVSVSGINISWHTIQGRGVIEGRHFLAMDETSARQVCLITPKLKEKLKLDKECTGQSVFVFGRNFRIVGVVEEMASGQMFGDSTGQDGEVFIPFNTAYKLWRSYMYVVAKARSTELSEEATAEIKFYLRKERHIKPGDPDTFRLEVVEQFIKQVKGMALVLTAVAGGIVGISLLVGGIGIMNIMLVSVSERTREIGLRKAVGARPGAIMLQFLVEAVMLCFIGGLIGIGIGQLLTMAISNIPGAQMEQAHMPFYAVMLAFGFSAVVGVFFGFFPAVKAARLDPIEALRHE